jgi:hypothetical protein
MLGKPVLVKETSSAFSAFFLANHPGLKFFC